MKKKVPDITDVIKVFMKNISGVYMDVAKKTFPEGTDVICSECGAISYLTTADCAYAYGHGWPEHCGKTMKIPSIK